MISPSAWRGLALGSSVLAEILTCSGVGGGIGYWISQTWQLSSIWIVLGSTLGLILAFYRIYKIFTKFSDKD